MNTKTILSFVLIIFFSFCGYSQESIIKDVDNGLLQKYIYMAMKNYPRRKALEARIERAKSTVDATKFLLLDAFTAGYYYRPENKGIGITGGTNSQLVTNGFQLGINVNLGNLLSRPSTIKGAKSDYEAAKAESDEYDATLVAQVKTLYYDFLLSKRQLELRSLSAQNLKALLNDAKEKYERAEITIDVYTASKNAATESEAQLLNAESTFLKAKNSLESIIGARIEDVR